jgi:hypothetical protein
MSIVEIAEQVTDKDSFIKFLQALNEDLSNNGEEWENPELDRYIEAMKGYLNASTESSINKVDFTPSWSLFAKIMVAASIYE